jgi:hypothetical protein
MPLGVPIRRIRRPDAHYEEVVVMSRSVDLFIDAEMSLEEMAEALGRCIGVALRSDDAGWPLDDGSIHAVLSEHPYQDDGDLVLSRYRFVVSARVANDGRPQDSAEAAFLRRVAGQIHRGPAWPVLVVLDLQYRDRTPGSESASDLPSDPAADGFPSEDEAAVTPSGVVVGARAWDGLADSPPPPPQLSSDER